VILMAGSRAGRGGPQKARASLIFCGIGLNLPCGEMLIILTLPIIASFVVSLVHFMVLYRLRVPVK
jgi:hypothetical protein